MSGKPAPRGAQKPTAAGPIGTPKGGAPTASFMKRGQAALETARHAAEASMGGGGAWRFWLNGDRSKLTVVNGTPNNECGIIILDSSINDLPGMWEHNLKIGGKFGNFEACPKEWAHCPLCDGGDRGYYVVFASILVLKPWTSKDGKKSGETTKMLLPIKSSQMGKMEELFAAATRKNGTLRGTFMHMRRDMNNQNSASIGEPSILDNGSVFDFYTDDELTENFGHPAETSPQGKLIKPQDEDITPFDYDAIFKKPDAADLRARYGGKIQPGSSQEAAEEWGQQEAADDDDALPGLEKQPPTKSRRSAPSRRGTPTSTAGADPFAEEGE